MNASILRSVIILAAGTMALGAAPVQAAYPDHTVRILLGFAPGGATDLVARMVAQKLSEKWGQPVVVENRPGADGTIAEDVVAHSAPDGYTLDIATLNHTFPSDEYKLNYDPIKSFAAISLFGVTPSLLLATNAFPAKTLKEAIAVAKEKPGQINFGSDGPRTSTYLPMAILMQRTGIKMTNITYKGGAPAMVALMGGEISLVFEPVVTTADQVKAGKVKALAISTDVRAANMPDVPTVAEAADLPGFNEGPYHGLIAPAGTPQAIIDKISADVAEALHSPDIAQKLTSQGYITLAYNAKQTQDFFAKDLAKWTAFLKSSEGK